MKNIIKNLPLILIALSIGIAPSIPAGTFAGTKIIELRVEDFLLLFFGLIWIAGLFISGRKKIEKPPLLFPILIWLIFGFFTVFTNWILGHLDIDRGFFYFLKTIEFSVFYFFVFYQIKDIKSAKLLIKVWIFLVAINIIYVVYQVYYRETTHDTFNFFGFRTGEYAYAALGEWGVFPTGAFFLIIFAFLFNVFIYYILNLKISKIKKLILGFIIISAILGVMGSSSKTTFLGLIFTILLILLFALFKKKSFKLIFITGAILIVVFILIFQNLSSTTRIAGMLSPQQVIISYKVGRIEAMKEEAVEFFNFDLMPILIGYGIGSVGEAHNQYIRNLVELGLIGSFIFLFLIFAILRMSFKIFLKGRDPLLVGLSAGLLTATFAMLFFSFATEPFIVVKPSSAYWFFAGMTMAVMRLRSRGEKYQEDKNKIEGPNPGIETKEIINCYFCGEKGNDFYNGLKDRSLDVSGLWSFLKCPKCGLVWLNPSPASGNIDNVYQGSYYTHIQPLSSKPGLREKIRMSLIAANFKKEELKIAYSKPLRILFKITPFLKDLFGKRAMMYLGKSEGGRLLDIGSGSGDFLNLMAGLGWQVQGVEPDKEAAELSRKRFGFKIIGQKFIESDLSSEYFDAITAKHVIEHIDDPVGFLKKAWQVLGSAGRLTATTPNIKSLGHLMFKKNWFPLEPPRHLFLFSAETLKEAALRAGLKNIEVKAKPVAAEKIYIHSKSIWETGKTGKPTGIIRKFSSLCFQFLEIVLYPFNKNLGEELVLFVRKETESPKKENICALVVSHSPDQSFVSNLMSIASQTDKIIIVNNGSDKFTPDFLGAAGSKDKIHLINNSENLGQAKALNQGTDWALNSGYQWILLLDQDSLLDQSMVSELIKGYNARPYKKRVGLIGSNCIFKNINEIKYQKECQGKDIFEREVAMMSGSLLSLAAYKEIGHFREEFFIDSIDADYCLRLRSKGFKMIIACKALMAHEVGRQGVMKKFAGRKLLVTNHNARRCYYMARNGLILAKEYFFKEPKWALKRIAWYFIYKPGLIIFYEEDKISKLRAMAKGASHALFGKTGK